MNTQMPRTLERKSIGTDDDDIAALVGELSTEHKKSIGAIETKTKTMESNLREIATSLEQVQAVLRRPGGGGLGGGANAGDLAAESKAIATFISTGNPDELKSMSVGSDPGGGYLVLPQFSTTMTKKLHDASPMRQLCRNIPIETGDSFSEPIDNDEGDAEWVGENSTRTEGDTPELAMFSVTLCEIYALQKVSQKLIDTVGGVGGISGGDALLRWLVDKIAAKFARKEGTAFLLGTRPVEPRGLLTYPTSYVADAARPWGTLQKVKSGAATGITADGLRDLTWAVRAPYRTGASWLMNSQTGALIDKLKDGNGSYIWREGSAAGVPPTLLGYPVFFAEDMPDVEAGALAIAFGNFNLAYTIIDKVGDRFLQDPFTAKPHILSYVYRRTGGGLNSSEPVKLMVIEAE